MSLTGNSFTDRLIPTAAHLVWAVREQDAAEIEVLLAEVRDEAGRIGIDALVLVLAAMVPDDATPGDLLGWLRNPDEYLRLREHGVSATAAGALARCQPAPAAAA